MNASKVMVVHRDPGVREELRGLLQEAGLEVVTLGAEHARFGLIRANQPDLLLLDAELPYLPPELIRRWMSEVPVLADVPVLVCGESPGVPVLDAVRERLVSRPPRVWVAARPGLVPHAPIE